MAHKNTPNFWHQPVQPWLAVTLVVAVVGFTYFFGLRGFARPVGINEVGGNTFTSTRSSFSPSTRPTFSPRATPCNKNVLTSLSVSSSESCGPYGFTNARYICAANNTGYSLGDGHTCLPAGTYQTQAAKLCPAVCPQPNLSPLPLPSRTPRPSATCTPRPACLDAKPACMIPITEDMCPPTNPAQ